MFLAARAFRLQRMVRVVQALCGAMQSIGRIEGLGVGILRP